MRSSIPAICRTKKFTSDIRSLKKKLGITWTGTEDVRSTSLKSVHKIWYRIPPHYQHIKLSYLEREKHFTTTMQSMFQIFLIVYCINFFFFKHKINSERNCSFEKKLQCFAFPMSIRELLPLIYFFCACRPACVCFLESL